MNKVRTPVVGLGAGGHAKVVIEILRYHQDYLPVGLLDANANLHGKSVLGVLVLGADDLLAELKSQGVEHFFMGIGGIRTQKPRKELFELALRQGFSPITLIHPTACVSDFAKIELGVTIMANVIVNPGVELGQNVILNSGAIVEHDCRIGDHAHIASGAVLAGGVVVGSMTLIGAGAVVRQDLCIGARSLVGTGAVVVKDVPDDNIVIGNPARAI